MTSYVPADLRRFVKDRAKSICKYCLIREEDTFLGCQIDHIIAEKHGGDTDSENLAYACAFCNRAKGSDIGSLAASNGDFVRLFNPRTDDWADHFSLQGSIIEPNSLIGEAPLSLLAINTPHRVLERKVLIAAGRYSAT